MTQQKVVESFQEALGKGDVPAAFSFFSNDVQWHQPGAHKFSGTKNGTEEIGAMLGGMMEHAQGSLVIVPNGTHMVNGSFVASPVRFSATSGDKKMDMSGIDLFEVKDGKITQVWLFSEDQGKEDAFWN